MDTRACWLMNGQNATGNLSKIKYPIYLAAEFFI